MMHQSPKILDRETDIAFSMYGDRASLTVLGADKITAYNSRLAETQVLCNRDWAELAHAYPTYFTENGPRAVRSEHRRRG